MGAFKRSLFGYRRDDVDAAIAARDSRFTETERELLILSEMLISREREVETLRQQLDDAHARHDRSLRSLEVLAGHLDELHAQARGQATRIRMKALNEAVRVTERANEALGAIRDVEQQAPQAPAKDVEPQPGPLGYFQGDVEVEIGPVGDFSQLLGFENAAGRIDGAAEVSVRRFAAGRATVGMRLDEPVELLRELEEHSPFEFKVRQTGGRRLILDIED